MLFSRDIGIDLGTSNTLVADRKGRILINEPSVVAVDVKTKRVVATGNQAKHWQNTGFNRCSQAFELRCYRRF